MRPGAQPTYSQYGFNSSPTNLNSPVLTTPKTYTNLNKKDLASIQNLIPAREKILFAGTLAKINRDYRFLRKIIVITDKNFYTIEKKKESFLELVLCAPSASFIIKKKININRILAITINTARFEEFIIHFKEDGDFRFKGEKKMFQVILAILNAHFSRTQENFVLYFRNEICLGKREQRLNLNSTSLRDKVFVSPSMVPNLLSILTDWKNYIYKEPTPPVVPYNPYDSSSVMSLPGQQYDNNSQLFDPVPYQCGKYVAPSFGYHFTQPPPGVIPFQPQYYIPEVQNQNPYAQQKPLISSAGEIPKQQENFEERKCQSENVISSTQRWDCCGEIRGDQTEGCHEIVWIKQHFSPKSTPENVQIQTNFENLSRNPSLNYLKKF